MMRTSLEVDELRALQPLDIAAYLRSKGWQDTSEEGAQISYWKLPEASAELVLPLSSVWRDYFRRIADVLDVLSDVENRSPTAIFDDLRESGHDTLRVHLASILTEDGTIPLGVGALTANALESLILAAACAEIRREQYYPSRKSDRANEHIRRHVRLAQTERGSYVLKVLTRVPPKLNLAASQTSMFDAPMTEEPFERRVGVRLANSLEALVSAAAIAGAKQSIEPMLTAVQHGVSANLCDAIIDLAGNVDDAELSMRFSWATSRPIVGKPPRDQISVPRTSFETLREASRVFKQNAPIPEFKVSGWVVTLDSGDPQSGGTVTVEAPVSGYWRKISVNLPAESYQQAIEAHKTAKRVRLAGDLERAGKRFSLARPSRLEIAEEDESATDEFFFQGTN